MSGSALSAPGAIHIITITATSAPPPQFNEDSSKVDVMSLGRLVKKRREKDFRRLALGIGN